MAGPIPSSSWTRGSSNANAQRNPRPKRKPCSPERQARVSCGHDVEAGTKVVHLARPRVVHAGARPDATEIEAQHRDTDAGKRLGALVHRFGVHRSAVKRMRMGEYRSGARLAVAGRSSNASRDPAGP